MADECSEKNAKEAAQLLDGNQVMAASQKLSECARSLTEMTLDEGKFRKFAERVAELDHKGQGHDLTLKYSIGRVTPYILEGLEIK